MQKTQLKTIYITRIDSDDLFHKDTIEEIQKQPFVNRRILIYSRGYLLTYRNQSILKTLRQAVGRQLTKWGIL